jgi:hypothetical protein
MTAGIVHVTNLQHSGVSATLFTGGKGGNNFKWRNACEVFATAHVLRSRLRWLAGAHREGPKQDGDDDRHVALSSSAATAGLALQVLLDLALGCLVVGLYNAVEPELGSA